MEITIRLGEICTNDTNVNSNTLQGREAEVESVEIIHLGFMTLVSHVSQPCFREQAENSPTVSNPAELLPAFLTCKCGFGKRTAYASGRTHVSILLTVTAVSGKGCYPPCFTSPLTQAGRTECN